jgi:hypothetical protein
MITTCANCIERRSCEEVPNPRNRHQNVWMCLDCQEAFWPDVMEAIEQVNEPEPRAPNTHPCVVCGVAFTPAERANPTCSQACAGAYARRGRS